MLSALRHHRRLVLAFFLLAAAFLYLAHIGSYHLIELDEGRYHRIPMEMVLSGDYLTPHFDYMPYFEKPILQYWVTALAMKIFGFKEFTGRVLPALTGFGNVLLAYVLGRSMYNGRTGLMAAIILATSALQLIVASIGVLDMALTFFVDACLVTFYLFERTEEKKYLLLFYTAMGLGMLTKGLIAIAFPVGILFWYAMLTRRPKLFLKLFYVPGILLFLAIPSPGITSCLKPTRTSFISSLSANTSCALPPRCTSASIPGTTSSRSSLPVSCPGRVFWPPFSVRRGSSVRRARCATSKISSSSPCGPA